MKRMEKEKEMQAKMEQGVKKELAARKKENEELRQLLSEETESLFVNLSRGNSEVRDLLERERDDLVRRLEDQRQKSVMLEQQLAHNSAEDERGRDEVSAVKQAVGELQELVTRDQGPLSVYFTAVREEAYTGGGEEYLTFSSCPLNTGGAMDNKSGIFTVPVTGR